MTSDKEDELFQALGTIAAKLDTALSKLEKHDAKLATLETAYHRALGAGGVLGALYVGRDYVAHAFKLITA
jgi:hypothetical protein